MTKVYRLVISYYFASINHVRNTWSGVRSGGISTRRQALSVWPRLSRGSQQGLRLHICYAGYLYFVTFIVSEVCWVVTKRRVFFWPLEPTNYITTIIVQVILNYLHPFRSTGHHQPSHHSQNLHPFRSTGHYQPSHHSQLSLSFQIYHHHQPSHHSHHLYPFKPSLTIQSKPTNIFIPANIPFTITFPSLTTFTVYTSRLSLQHQPFFTL